MRSSSRAGFTLLSTPFLKQTQRRSRHRCWISSGCIRPRLGSRHGSEGSDGDGGLEPLSGNVFEMDREVSLDAAILHHLKLTRRFFIGTSALSQSSIPPLKCQRGNARSPLAHHHSVTTPNRPVHGELLFQGVAHGFACLLIAPNRLPLRML